MESTTAIYPLPTLAHKNAALQITTVCLDIPELPEHLTLSQVQPAGNNRPAWFIAKEYPLVIQDPSETTKMTLTFTFFRKYPASENEIKPVQKLNMILTEVPYDENTVFTSESEQQDLLGDMGPDIIETWVGLLGDMDRINARMKEIAGIQKSNRSGRILN